MSAFAASPAEPHVTKATHMAPSAGSLAREGIRAAGPTRTDSRMLQIAAIDLHQPPA